MNLIKSLGNDKFEINLAPEAAEWLREMARANEGSSDDEAVAHALNGAIVQMYAGWRGFKRRIYELELESVQAVKADVDGFDGDSLKLEISNELKQVPIDLDEPKASETPDPVIDDTNKPRIRVVALRLPKGLNHAEIGDALTEAFNSAEVMTGLKNSITRRDESKADTPAYTEADFFKTPETTPEVVDLVQAFFSDLFPADQRAKLGESFLKIKERVAASLSNETQPDPAAIAKDAINKALNKCACGNPECTNGYTQEDINKYMAEFIKDPEAAMAKFVDKLKAKNDRSSKQ